MDKFKFYTFKLNMKVTDLINNITSNNDELFGIKLISHIDNCIKFTYYEHKIIETTFIDKNFKEQTIEHIRTDNFNFYIYTFDDVNLLSLHNPYRNLTFFKNYISKKLFNNLIINSIKINPISLLDFLSTYEITSSVSSLEVKDIQISKTTTATLTIKSNDNLFCNFKDYIKYDNYTLSKALYTIDSEFKGKILLSSDTSLSLQIHSMHKFIELFIIFLKLNLQR